MHNVSYVEHPGYQEIIAVVRGQCFWHGVKKDVADYIARYMECQKVKMEHTQAKLLQLFPIPEWKWEEVMIDFITKLPKTRRQHDSIMVVVDMLKKMHILFR
jgi:hypothetical protein